MIHPLQLIWLAFIFCLCLALIVLLEIKRINYRREHEEMFGTKTFDEKVLQLNFSDKEKRTLDKIIRYSSFENKDAVLNSAEFFESAVSNFYDIRNVLDVRDETLDAITSIRNKLNFIAKNPLAAVYSTRQFSVNDRIDLILDNDVKVKHSQIIAINEKNWVVTYDSDFLEPVYINKSIKIRWTRPEDAIYSTTVFIQSISSKYLVLSHASSFEKRQLRRWVRMQVDFPVLATFEDSSTSNGALLDLSAGGIMLGIPRACNPGESLRIKFDLPSFGTEDVEIQILRNLGHKSETYPSYYCLTASFSGAFGWTQERVLQYLFEANKEKK